LVNWKKLHNYVGPILVATGALLVVMAAVVAYGSFYGYRLPAIQASTLEESIALLVGALVDIATRLGFLGVIVWAGSVLLRYGVQLLRAEHPTGKPGERS